MSFWQNVENELLYQGISRKDLAYKAGISYSSIGNGIDRNSMPSAETALRISKVLNRSIEFLIGDSGNGHTLEKGMLSLNEACRLTETELYRKYEKIIDVFEQLSVTIREPLFDLILHLANTHSAGTPPSKHLYHIEN